MPTNITLSYGTVSGGTVDVDLNSGFTSTVTSNFTWYFPLGIAGGGTDLYVGGAENNGDSITAIHRVAIWTGEVLETVDNFTDSDGAFVSPQQFCFYQGNLYLFGSDGGGYFVQKYTGFSNTPAPGGKIYPVPFAILRGIDFDASGNLCLISYGGWNIYLDRFVGYSTTPYGAGNPQWAYSVSWLSFIYGLTIFDGDVITCYRLSFGGPSPFCVRLNIDNGSYIDGFQPTGESASIPYDISNTNDENMFLPTGGRRSYAFILG
jgi:hypothetical protein